MVCEVSCINGIFYLCLKCYLKHAGNRPACN
uniref:Uncharacterized protein n=1 Tax=Anguilla anguilla TaxID=7936 RepID=A0A0E9WWR7_ANGAN